MIESAVQHKAMEKAKWATFAKDIADRMAGNRNFWILAIFIALFAVVLGFIYDYGTPFPQDKSILTLTVLYVIFTFFAVVVEILALIILQATVRVFKKDFSIDVPGITSEEEIFYNLYSAYKDAKEYYKGRKQLLSNVRSSLKRAVKIMRTIANDKMDTDYVGDRREKLLRLINYIEMALYPTIVKTENGGRVNSFFEAVLPYVASSNLGYDESSLELSEVTTHQAKGIIPVLLNMWRNLPYMAQALACFISILAISYLTSIYLLSHLGFVFIKNEVFLGVLTTLSLGLTALLIKKPSK